MTCKRASNYIVAYNIFLYMLLKGRGHSRPRPPPDVPRMIGLQCGNVRFDGGFWKKCFRTSYKAEKGSRVRFHFISVLFVVRHYSLYGAFSLCVHTAYGKVFTPSRVLSILLPSREIFILFLKQTK